MHRASWMPSEPITQDAAFRRVACWALPPVRTPTPSSCKTWTGASMGPSTFLSQAPPSASHCKQTPRCPPPPTPWFPQIVTLAQGRAEPTAMTPLLRCRYHRRLDSANKHNSIPPPFPCTSRECPGVLTSCQILQVRTFKGLYQSTTFWSEVPIQVAAEREIARYNFAQVCFPRPVHVIWQQCCQPPPFSSSSCRTSNLESKFYT